MKRKAEAQLEVRKHGTAACRLTSVSQDDQVDSVDWLEGDSEDEDLGADSEQSQGDHGADSPGDEESDDDEYNDDDNDEQRRSTTNDDHHGRRGTRGCCPARRSALTRETQTDRWLLPRRLDAARLLLDLRFVQVAAIGSLVLLVDARERLLERVL